MKRAHYFAPGAIDATPRRSRLRPRQRWARAYVTITLTGILVGLVAGYCQAKGWPL